MSDIQEQTEGATGATESEGVQDPTPAEEPGISNSEAKKLPWVRELMSAKAELDQFKKSQADAEARAEREKAEAEGRYQEALEMETKARQDAEASYKAELKKLRLETEFTKAGLVDPRAVKLFETEFDSESMDAAEFVASIKADEANQLYFVDPSRRVQQKPPAPNAGPPDDFDPERDLVKWLNSSDGKKRARAIEYNRQKYERQLKRG